VNPADWKSADGGQAALIGFEWPRVIGFDFSGVVVEVAKDCDDEFKIGDQVFGMIAGLPERDRGKSLSLSLNFLDCNVSLYLSLFPSQVVLQNMSSLMLRYV